MNASIVVLASRNAPILRFTKVGLNGNWKAKLTVKVILLHQVLKVFTRMNFSIVPDKCTECVGFHDEPQCAAVCPVDCCVPDPNHVESKEELLAKKEKLDQIGR
jgi:ferredoxin